MKTLIALLPTLLIANALATDTPAQSTASPDGIHRYFVKRTFPAGALQSVDAAAKERVNAANASVGVNWVRSYANADETKTYCVYEGPNEAAIRKAAELNKMTVDSLTEIPVDLDPGTPATSASSGSHRYLVERTLTSGALKNMDAAAKAKTIATDARFGVHWVTSYASADKTKTYWIYEAPNEAAVRKAASANGMPADTVTEVPVVLLPH